MGTQDTSITAVTAVCFDFINHLKRKLRGWRLTPLASAIDERLVPPTPQHPQHNIFTFLAPSPNQSPYELLAESGAKQHCFILIKPPKRRSKIHKHVSKKDQSLRCIELRMTNDTQCLVLYRGAQGWKQTQKPIRGNRVPEIKDGQIMFQTWRIERIEGSKGQRYIARDVIYPAIPQSTASVAERAAQTLCKSYDMRGLAKGDFFKIGVRLDGRNFSFLESWTGYRTVLI